MKKISELGLELIELEDQVLLVDKKSKKGKFYFVDNSIGKRIESAETRPSGKVYEIIASTKPLEGLPLLVIEDEVEILAEHSSEVQEATYTPPYKTTYKHGFMDGYNKAKETFKFTEEDMVEFAMNMISQYQFGNTNIHNRGMLRESLPKKELWIEVEFKETKSSVFRENDNAPYGIYEPKITNNQIKAVWNTGK